MSVMRRVLSVITTLNWMIDMLWNSSRVHLWAPRNSRFTRTDPATPLHSMRTIAGLFYATEVNLLGTEDEDE